MIDKSVAIAALARNCEINLPANIDRIEELRKHFVSSTIFIYENNSTDNTKVLLKDWQKKSESVYLKSEDIDESSYRTKGKIGKLYRGTDEGRIRKMCDCRNKLIDMIQYHGQYDYVIFMDIDIKKFSVEGIVRSIENAPEDWGALFANCYVTYWNGNQSIDSHMHYDMFAYLKKGKNLQDIKHNDLNPFKRSYIANRLYHNICNSSYLECESAFGGLGIYKGDMIDGNKYELFTPVSWGETNSTLCEHILFNIKIKGKKYISNELKVCYHYFDLKGLKWIMAKHTPLFFYYTGLLKDYIMN